MIATTPSSNLLVWLVVCEKPDLSAGAMVVAAMDIDCTAQHSSAMSHIFQAPRQDERNHEVNRRELT